MKTKSQTTRVLLSILVLWLLRPHAAWATLPEPDAIVYGTIKVPGTNLITDADTNFVVQVFRGTSPDGFLVASYRMGANANLGSRYAVEIPLETVDASYPDFPLVNPLASEVGNQVTLAVTQFTNHGGTTNYTNHFVHTLLLSSRGMITRIDFPAQHCPPDDFTAWLDLYGLSAEGGSGDRDRDGVTNLGEYLAGTDPTNTNDVFRIEITQFNNSVEVSFPTRAIAGDCYSYTERLYTLEQATNLMPTTGSAWVQVPGVIDVPGTNQVVRYTNSLSWTNPVFYRASIRLQRLP